MGERIRSSSDIHCVVQWSKVINAASDRYEYYLFTLAAHTEEPQLFDQLTVHTIIVLVCCVSSTKPATYCTVQRRALPGPCNPRESRLHSLEAETLDTLLEVHVLSALLLLSSVLRYCQSATHTNTYISSLFGLRKISTKRTPRRASSRLICAPFALSQSLVFRHRHSHQPKPTLSKLCTSQVVASPIARTCALSAWAID